MKNIMGGHYLFVFAYFGCFKSTSCYVYAIMTWGVKNEMRSLKEGENNLFLFFLVQSVIAFQFEILTIFYGARMLPVNHKRWAQIL